MPTGIEHGMQVLARASLTPAVVIDQSCDTLRADRILFAPLLPCIPQGKTAEKQWAFIHKLATDLHEPTRLYLPGYKACSIPRMIVDLGGKFTLPLDMVRQFICEDRRVLAMTGEGLRYLQFRLGLMLSRVARDDESWASKDDLDLKIGALEKGIDRATSEIRSKSVEAERAKTQEEKERLLDEVEARNEEKAVLEAERDATISARDAAAAEEEREALAVSAPQPMKK